MAHRPLHEIDAERATLEARLADLLAEREQARQAEIETMCRMFDAGLDVQKIARGMNKTKAAVQGVLFRSGRTEIGRTAIRHQIDAHVGAHAAAT